MSELESASALDGRPASLADPVAAMSTAHRSAIAEDDRARYYAAAMAALRFIEQRTPTTRRFGPEADARWSAFKGNLETADRIDVLLRDADAQWPAALGARNVFALRAAAEDEAFGVEWEPLDAVAAEDLWRSVSVEPAPQGVAAALAAVAAGWGLSLRARLILVRSGPPTGCSWSGPARSRRSSSRSARGRTSTGRIRSCASRRLPRIGSSPQSPRRS